MSIVMNLYYTGEKDNAIKFALEMESSKTADLIRKSKGNLRYEYIVPVNDENTVLLIDEWQSQDALDRHHASPVMETILKLRKKYNLTVRAQRYTPDNENISAADKEYIEK